MKTNSKQGLISMLETNQSYHMVSRDLKVIEGIKNLNLQDLDNGYTYTTRYKSESKEEIIKHLEYWNGKLDCIDFKDEEVVAIVEIEEDVD